MGLSCVDGLTNSGFLAHIWALKEHKQRSGGRTVRRRLFGNVGGADAARNSRNNIRFARQQLEKMAKADSERWNFDFTAMRPKEGPLEWRAVDENTTPMSSSSSSPALPCHLAASSRLQLPATSTCNTPASPSRNVLGTRGNDINTTTTANATTTTTMGHGNTFTNTTTSTSPIASTSKTSPTTTTTTTNNDNSSASTSRVSTNTATTTTKTKTKRDSKHQLKRLIRKEPNTNNNKNTRRGFRQTLCTDYFKTVRTARA